MRRAVSTGLPTGLVVAFNNTNSSTLFIFSDSGMFPQGSDGLCFFMASFFLPKSSFSSF